MTTNNKLEKTLANAKGLTTDLKKFSLDSLHTNDQNAKQMFSKLSTNIEEIS